MSGPGETVESSQAMENGDVLAEKLLHTIDLLRAEMHTGQQDQTHELDMLRAELTRLRDAVLSQKEFVDHRIGQLEHRTDDHESRIRSATDGVTQFKVWSGLAAGGSGLVSLAALLRSLFGG